MKQIEYVAHLLRFAFGHNRLLYLGVFISLMSVVIELLAMSSLLPLFELVSGQKEPSAGYIVRILEWGDVKVTATSLLLCFIVFFTLRILTLVSGQSLALFLGKRVQAQLGSMAFTQIIQNIPISDINRNSIGFYISLAGDEAFRASTLIITLTQFISTAALSLLYFYAIAIFSPAVALMVVIFLILCAAVLFRILRISHRLGSEQIEQSRSASSAFIDGINNLKVVRAFNAENYVVDIYTKKIFAYTRTLFMVDQIALLTKFIPVFILIACMVLWFSISTESMESVGIAFIVTMIVYLMRFFPTVGQGVTLLLKLVSDARSGKDVTAIISDMANEQACEKNNDLDKVIETIVLEDIGFTYPGSESPVLDHVNYRFVAGKSYALVGPSGTGKSTLVDLLLKFLAPDRGKIFFNDKSSNDINSSRLRNRVLLVSQEPAIFDDSVFNNIGMGMEASPEQVRSACKVACIDDVIEVMEDGYDTRLQYQGKNISGGQRQRIALARALLRNPDVLVLDESTSALDKVTQEQVVGNILTAYRDKIVIFVTHDPYIASRVDHVFDLKKTG